MGMIAPSSKVNIYQTAISTQFTEKHFIVVDGSIKSYDLIDTLEPGSDIVLINGLYQVRGSDESYTIVDTSVVFNTDTILTPGDDIGVYYIKQV